MFRITLVVILVGVLRLTAHAEDWPTLGRDRTHNAVSPEKGAPVDWQNALPATNDAPAKAARNIKWKAKLGSSSVGGPVIAGGLVWVGTNNHSPRDPRDTRLRKDGKREPIDMSVLMCFREADGQFLWQYTSPRLGNLAEDGPSDALGSTPLVEGDRLCVLTNRWQMLCLDTGPLRRGDGPPKEIWKVDMRKEFGVRPHGYSMARGLKPSPAADVERVFIVTGNGVDESHVNIPAPNAPSLICFDKMTGKVLWTDNSPGKDILHEQYSTPLVIAVNGRTQVIVGQGDGWLRSFESETGKLIWKCDLNPKGAKWELGGRGRRSGVMATPVYCDGRVYIATGQDPEHFDGEGHLYCIDPIGTGDVSAELDDGRGGGKPNPNSRVVWQYGGPAPKGYDRDWLFGRSMSNCVVHDGLVYAIDLAGFVHCFDAKAGRLFWRHDLMSAIWGSPLWVDGKLYVSAEDGDVSVFAHGKEKKLLTKFEMSFEVFRVAPVFANGTLYVTTESMLYAIQAPK